MSLSSFAALHESASGTRLTSGRAGETSFRTAQVRPRAIAKRWIVERTIAWLNRCRRLAKDRENLNRTALAFLKLASIRLMLRKLCNP
jgi:transposase